MLRMWFLGVFSGILLPNPKLEIRSPKEIRNPKPETTHPRATGRAD